LLCRRKNLTNGKNDKKNSAVPERLRPGGAAPNLGKIQEKQLV